MAGNVHKRPNGQWRARYRDASHREHARHFSRKVDAERWLAAMEVSISRGEWLDPAHGKVRVGDWAAQWLADQVQLKPSTFARYELILRKQVLPTWERMPLSKVTFADVGVWVQELSASHLSAASVRQAHRVFSLLLDHAVHDGRLARNPAKGVRLPRVSPAHMVFLTHEHVDQLAKACAPYDTLVHVLAYTGIRWGEAAALRVGRVDLERRRLSIDEATSEVGGKVIFGTPKTHKRRVVPFPAFLAGPLTELIDGRGPGELLFTAPGGGVLRNTNFRSRVFEPAKADLGLGALRIHDLRHTAASLAVAAGANVKVVQRMLGHASAAMTLDVYTGLFADDLDSVAERLDVAAAQSRADSLRTADVLTLAEARSKRASQGVDLRKHVVGPVGLEPTTYGLKVRCSTN